MITESTRADIEAGSEMYFVRGSVVVDPGFAAIYTYARSADEEIPKLEEGQRLDLDGDPWLVDKETQPPSRISQGKLIELMEERAWAPRRPAPTSSRSSTTAATSSRNPPEPSETGIAMYMAFNEVRPADGDAEDDGRARAGHGPDRRRQDLQGGGAADQPRDAPLHDQPPRGEHEDFAKQIWTGMDEDKFLGPCKVCEEAGRKHEDGSPNRLRIIQLKGGKRMYGCEGWIRPPEVEEGQEPPPPNPTPAPFAARFPAAATSSGAWRSAARSAARCRASRSRASAAAPGSSASTTTARRWSRCARSGRASERRARGGQGGGEPSRRRRPPATPRSPAQAATAAGVARNPRRRRRATSAPAASRQVGSSRVHHARGHRPLGQDDPGGPAGATRWARHAAAARARRHGGRRARPRPAEGPDAGVRAPAPSCCCSAPPARALRERDRPAMDGRPDVICDRFIDSTAAYQGAARGLGHRPGGALERGRGRRLRARPDAAAAHRPGRRGGARTAAAGRGRGRRFRPLRGRGHRASSASSPRPTTRSPAPPGAGRGDRRRGGRTRCTRGSWPRCGRASMSDQALSSEALADATEHQPAARAALAAALGCARCTPICSAGRRGAGKRGGGAGLRRRAPGRGGARSRRCAAAGAGRPVAAPRPRLAASAGHPAPRRGGPRRVIAASAYRPFEGGAPRVRGRGRGGDGRGEPERAAEDAGGAGRVRPHPPDQRRAGAAARDRPLALPDGALHALPAAGGGGAAQSGGPGRRPGERRRRQRGLPAATRRWPKSSWCAPGSELRAAAAACVDAARSRRPEGSPWSRPDRAAREEAGRGRLCAGPRRASAARRKGPVPPGLMQSVRAKLAEEAGEARRPAAPARRRSISRSRSCGAWLRDLVAVAERRRGARAEPRPPRPSCARRRRPGPRRARRAGELVMDTRRRLQVNVGEELALEALSYRLEALLSAAEPCSAHGRPNMARERARARGRRSGLAGRSAASSASGFTWRSAFAAVALIAAGLSYVLASTSSEDAAASAPRRSRSAGRCGLADRIGAKPASEAQTVLTSFDDPAFAAWVFDAQGKLTHRAHRERHRTSRAFREGSPLSLPPSREPGDRRPAGSVTVASVPVFRNGKLEGAVLVASRARAGRVTKALKALRGDRLTATAIAGASSPRDSGRVDREPHHNPDQAAGPRAPSRIAEGRSTSRSEGTGGTRRDHRPRQGARDDADRALARRSSRCARSATASARSSTRSTTPSSSRVPMARRAFKTQPQRASCSPMAGCSRR